MPARFIALLARLSLFCLVWTRAWHACMEGRNDRLLIIAVVEKFVQVRLHVRQATFYRSISSVLALQGGGRAGLGHLAEFRLKPRKVFF